ncbi:ATP-binding protein [Streptosporangium canum]|uniref:ATP-binding protein n=1 Tax=Streptosporangium canum TaxID=324952 RepID=UPI0037B61487
MTAQAPLLYIDGATEGTTQWKAETFQMVNWGGFEGHHQIAFSSAATLISGASGTGKSTLLDGYLALMMPSDTPFNGASNDAASGRARGADQRNLVTYLKGKTDSSRQAGTGELHDQVLRGADGPTWGAIAMTFVNDNGRRYTALRAYYLPRGATKFADVAMKMATKDGYLDLRELAPLAKSRFDAGALKAQFPGIVPHRTYAEFEETLFTRLGIGANGDGRKALRLLSRIQGGQQVKTVDGLYKSMVLEEPATYAAADKAIGHFGDLERAYEAMVTEADKATVLEHLPALHGDFKQATSTADAIDALGIHRDGDTPFLLWRLHTERSLLADTVEANRTSRGKAHDEYKDARTREAELKIQIEDLKQQIRANGGDALAALKNDLQRLTDELNHVVEKREKFDDRVRALSAVVHSEDDFLQLGATAKQFMNSFDKAERGLEAQQRAKQREMYPFEERRRELKEEKDSLSGRAGLVPPLLHNARMMIAQAAGIPPEDLPFVAELIDLAPGEEKWRKAAEITLASVARILLLDEDLLEQLSRAIDPLRIPVRINFEGVALHLHEEFRGDPRRISGKLIFKDSLFSRWVQERVRASNIDALCVSNPAELNSGGPCVTLNGQTRNGRRGAHGELRDRNIIGFSNKARLAEIEQELVELETLLETMSKQAAATKDKIHDLHGSKTAYQFVLDTDWRVIDVAGVEAKIEKKKTEHERILADSDILRALQSEEERKSKEQEEAQRKKHLAEQEVNHLDVSYEKLVDHEDRVNTDIDRIEREHSTSLREELSNRLDREFANVGDRSDLAGFPDAVKRLRARLVSQSKHERENAQKARESLERVFQAFQGRWPDPNLGQSIASYRAYRDILDNILATGLHERRQEWKRRLSKWSGEDLVPLNGAFDTSIEEIEDRLYPVNDILATLPFGAGRDRLKIVLRRLHHDDLTKFRRELKLLSSGATEKLTDEQTETRFRRLRGFMGQIRKPEGGSKSTAQRDYLLDVRKHVEITAARVTTEGVEISTYASLGGKSGGETQELVAFIVGAALRFQLGDESRTRPRFAPVILDEGFVKSDSEFAGRAVQAWKGLGFQLIIGAPLDKVTALEPYMDLVLAMTKDNKTGYSYVTPLASTTGAAS